MVINTIAMRKYATVAKLILIKMLSIYTSIDIKV